MRLLAVERPLRGGLIFAGLCYLIHAYARRRGEMPRRILRDVALWRRHVASVGKEESAPQE
ncbi:MAG: hypothetical protein O7J95_20985 [Planctomycetota bacterium]|nr:hypothetical protein [Planctomycetota bacterium]